MKKILTVLFVLLMLCACSSKNEEQKKEEKPQEQQEVIGENTPNPMKEYTSLDEINEELHSKLVAPAVMGVDNEKFFIIKVNDVKKIGEYDFTINGYECTFRFCDRATADEDISGIYIDGKPAFPSENTEYGFEMNQLDNTRVARWLNMDGQYSFAYTNGDCDDETFASIVEELMTLTEADGNGSK